MRTLTIITLPPGPPICRKVPLYIVLYLCPHCHLQDPNTGDPTAKCDDHKSGYPGNQSAVAKREWYAQKPSAYLYVDQPEEPTTMLTVLGRTSSPLLSYLQGQQRCSNPLTNAAISLIRSGDACKPCKEVTRFSAF